MVINCMSTGKQRKQYETTIYRLSEAMGKNELLVNSKGKRKTREKAALRRANEIMSMTKEDFDGMCDDQIRILEDAPHYMTYLRKGTILFTSILYTKDAPIANLQSAGLHDMVGLVADAYEKALVWWIKRYGNRTKKSADDAKSDFETLRKFFIDKYADGPANAEVEAVTDANAREYAEAGGTT
ncbi:hypothetical protein BDV96DRAFT_648171 [Lophiotrema nucula]|uniref:Uncharacterized protein n=1 Tax=Lophiotrema nucula TaxID=690887 RepID=A0A6A5Z161_9PLEO|nr:hypothetical protein BDV96DRAFT_648171 [Lophiotrema nucula]